MTRKINPVQVLADYVQLQINADTIMNRVREMADHSCDATLEIGIQSYFDYDEMCEERSRHIVVSESSSHDDDTVAIGSVLCTGGREFPLFVPAELLGDPSNAMFEVFLASVKAKVMEQVEKAEYKSLSNFYNQERNKIERYFDLKKKHGDKNEE